MVEVLERTVKKNSPAIKKTVKGAYPIKNSAASYSTFAEMYLEKPAIDGVTCSMCTWRKIPTIDDW
jgi:hypothetical protein